MVCYWSTDSGLVEQEEVVYPSTARTFLALAAPSLIFSRPDSTVEKVPLRDFVDLDGCDEGTRTALLDFSRLMATGDLDGAFNAIKLIRHG